MRFAIPDDYQKVIQTLDCFQLLKGHEVRVIHEYMPDPQQLAVKLGDPEVLILTRTRTKVDEQLLSLLPNLKIISQTGKNAGHIDVQACQKYGVTVLEGRGNPIATAELTWALIMNGMRLIPQAIEGMKKGQWQVNIGRRIYGKRIGIWGFGKIGKKIAAYAETFGAEVMVWGSELSRNAAHKAGYLAASSKPNFFSSCDIISLHLRLNSKTEGIVKISDLLSMKTDALLVNTARASLIEKGALLSALQAGRPGYAAIDVYDAEPVFDADFPFLHMDNVICTPHIGYVERASYELYFSIAFENVLDWISQKT